tara:strand:- start:107 stop:352 length:246 start_codon:yes stop_codon:yes gene_type:complete
MQLTHDEEAVIMNALHDYSTNQYIAGNQMEMVTTQNLIKKIEESKNGVEEDSGPQADAGSETGIELEERYSQPLNCEVCDD